jgi:hypothetical protein
MTVPKKIKTMRSDSPKLDKYRLPFGTMRGVVTLKGIIVVKP